MEKFKVYWVVLCKNEEEIIPWCIRYWSRIADKVIVYDNHSTDSSVELLSKYDWIEIRTFDSGGKQNDIIQKEVKEKAYLEFKDECSMLICTDMDEIFYFKDFETIARAFIDGEYDCLVTPICSLCEDSMPKVEEGKLLHQQCHKFYKQKMNHMAGFENLSKISIFNCKTVSNIQLSVGQHYVRTLPNMKIMLAYDGFCLHLDKGFGWEYQYNVRQRMYKNLSETNKNGGMCGEYGYSKDKIRKEYLEHQEKSFNLNEILCVEKNTKIIKRIQ